jgi:hypothetical protein
MISHMRVPPDRPGRIILLNETSSSGKTSIAEELLLILDPPHFHMAGRRQAAAQGAQESPESRTYHDVPPDRHIGD